MPDYKRVLNPISEEELPVRSALERLGRAMTQPKDGEILADDCDTDGPQAGYTYFGQFIDHDITEDHSAVPDGDGKIDVAAMKNRAVPWLDLHHVYGFPIDLSKAWYDDTSSDEAKLFRLDPTVSGQAAPDVKAGAKLDLPRSECGEPLIPDGRNSENLIIAQLHVLFLRWHNLAVSQIDKIKCPKGLPGNTPFERARALVTWQYQYLVRWDYLPQIIDSKLRNDARRFPTFFTPKSAADMFVPVEFSAAAFRFGHSMVRQSYRYNDWQIAAHKDKVVTVEELMNNAKDFKALPHDWLIDWSRFFPGPRHFVQREPAQQINTQLASALHETARPLVQRFSDVDSEINKAGGGSSNTIDLPARTLLRGRALRLATGQQAAQEFKEKEILGSAHLDFDREGKLLPSFQELRDLGLSNKTPLFYYVLWEAERMQCGNMLGRVGGRIVAEVIEGLLRHDPHGYIKNTKAGERWQPPKWTFPDGTRRKIEHFGDVIELLDAWLPPGHPPIGGPPLLSRLRYRRQWLRAKLRAVHRSCWHSERLHLKLLPR
jgi:hypothetical protein